MLLAAGLKLKTQPGRLGRSIQAFKEWVKLVRNRMKLDKLWLREALVLLPAPAAEAPT